LEQQAQAISDSLQASHSVSTAFDSIWAGANTAVSATSGYEDIMLSHDKIYVVLAVLGTIWLGIIVLLLRSDRRIDQLERSLEDRIHESEPLL
jgi:hypothetical protein